ncbi:MAG: hypothetical protein JG776_487 [Caloramator sp.]|jgi:hypothetical protein|uniref:hypothetical protein n=1 Tax=Caloramator sp. TaxID=1871330 RepID=UPI001D27FAFC|nr:hypothetical protein [Caloramator sp.]MBZ4662805.1 hypothetical protein [Caloramator sp.]
MDNRVIEYQQNNLSIIDTVSIQQVQNTMQKITQFQKVIQQTLHQNHDFGVVPGSAKPTLLKPGAEKILMMMGLRSEFEIVDSTRDFENGFFQYQVRCKLFKGDTLITEGLGACNTREKKYRNQDAFTLDNTVLKMAKKRALVDATLLVASLSDIFTQDLEDLDLEGNTVVNVKTTFDDDKTISKAQARRLYALSNGNAELCKRVIEKYGYKKSDDIKLIDYEKIAKEIEEEANKTFEGTPFEVVEGQ